MTRRRKVTLVMEDGVLYDVRQAVASGLAPSQSGLVEQAVVEYLERRRREAVAAAYADAARDPVFLSDMDEILSDFERLDQEVDG